MELADVPATRAPPPDHVSVLGAIRRGKARLRHQNDTIRPHSGRRYLGDMDTPSQWYAVLRSTMALFIIIDPVGLLPVVMALTTGQDTLRRQRVLYSSTLVAVGLLIVLTFAARAVFGLYGIQMSDFQIAGGLVLFGVALNTIHERHWGDGVGGPMGIVPIACPLLVGPGAITTSLFILDMYGAWVTVVAIVAAFFLTFLTFRSTNTLYRILGETGAGVVARLMGMLLAAIAVQFIRQGVVTTYEKYIR
jgi:multiple antibiotic resistance protein